MPRGRDFWIPLAGGLGTDITDDLLPVGRSLDITNMHLLATGKLAKRFGHTAFAAPADQGTWQLANYKGARVELSGLGTGSTPTPISVYSPAKASWVSPTTDRHSPMNVSLSKIATKGAGAPRFATGGGYHYAVYPDLISNSTWHFDVIDPASL